MFVFSKMNKCERGNIHKYITFGQTHVKPVQYKCSWLQCCGWMWQIQTGRGLCNGRVISAHPKPLSNALVLLCVNPQHYSDFTAFTQANESLLNTRLSKCTYILKKSRKAPKLSLFNSLSSIILMFWTRGNNWSPSDEEERLNPGDLTYLQRGKYKQSVFIRIKRYIVDYPFCVN